MLWDGSGETGIGRDALPGTERRRRGCTGGGRDPVGIRNDGAGRACGTAHRRPRKPGAVGGGEAPEPVGPEAGGQRERLVERRTRERARSEAGTAGSGHRGTREEGAARDPGRSRGLEARAERSAAVPRAGNRAGRSDAGAGGGRSRGLLRPGAQGARRGRLRAGRGADPRANGAERAASSGGGTALGRGVEDDHYDELG